MDELRLRFVSYHAERVTVAMAAVAEADGTAETPLDPNRKDESAVTSAHCRVTDSSRVEENTFFLLRHVVHNTHENELFRLFCEATPPRDQS